MHKTLSSFRKIFRSIPIGFLLAVICTGPLWASGMDASLLLQERIVTGKVISADDGLGFPGVNIIVKGTTIGTVTDATGKYSISVESGSTLVFSSIGFKTVEMAVGSQSVVDISMETDVTSLAEVVVVGYGTQEKREITAAISSLNSEALSKIATTNTLEGMKGQIAGVDV